MTTYDYGASTVPPSTGIDEDTSAKDQAMQAASTAADESKDVVETVKNEARSVAEDAGQQARSLLEEAIHQVEDQSRSQLESLIDSLQGFAEDLEQMARGDGAGAGMAREVVTEVSQKVRALSDQLQSREPGDLLDQARGFARQRPATFLLGSLAAGIVAGRVARSVKDAPAPPTPDARQAGATL